MPILFRCENGACTAYGPQVHVQFNVDERSRRTGATITAGGSRYDFGPDEVPRENDVSSGRHALARAIDDTQRAELASLLRLIEDGGAKFYGLR